MNGEAPPTGRRLHVGGTIRAPGWEVVNVVTAADFSRLSGGTFDAVYASHVLEHLSPRGQLENGLREWHRVLRPAGTLYVSVPDRHEIGFNDELLRHFLVQADFVKIRRVQSLGKFRDTSELRFKGVRISPNVIAEKSA